VMEFVRGKTLDDVIRAQGAMRCDQAINLFCMALEGIDHAHKMGIVHRDIKPANMMLTETGSIKVMDFGIARVLGTDRLTKAGHLIGTVEYMSPEQVRGEETDARSDIYSLGILLYEMLTGRVPFTNSSEYELMRCQIEQAPTPPRTFAPHIPLSVEQAIMRSLAKKREARYQSASEFRSMLMMRNTGAVTRPLTDPAVRTGDFAAPTTHADYATRTTPPPSGDVVKATRLAGDSGVMQAAAAGDVKATRLMDPAQGAPANYPPPQAVQTPAGQTSFLSKLNWKHYAGVGVVALVAIMAGAFALVRGGSKPMAAPPVTITEPASEAQSSDASSTPSDPAAAPAQSVQPAAPQPAPGATVNQPPAAGSPSPSASANRSRAGAAKTTDTPSVSQQAPAQPPSETQPPPPKQDKVAVSNPAEKKEADKKEAEKKPEKRGFFGKIKDAITGGGDANKKKDPKKP